VERHSRDMPLAKVDDESTVTVVSTLFKQAKRLPFELFESLTWDPGTCR
jgi:IS30 family transposase